MHSILNCIILYIKTVSKILRRFFWWLFLHHLGMREVEQRITFCCFLSLTADRYYWCKEELISFFFFLIVGSKRWRGLQEKKMTPSESRRNRLLKVQFFFEKYPFLPGVKKSPKKGKNSGFRKRIYFKNCGCSLGNRRTVLILVPTESQFNENFSEDNEIENQLYKENSCSH